MRRVLTGIPGKTGVVYTLDRETGEFLWARPTVTQNVISAIDGATGEVTENAEAHLHGRGAGGADLPDLVRREGLGGRRLQPADQRHVHAAAQHLRADDGHAGRRASTYALALRHQLAPGTDQPRNGPGDLGRDRRTPSGSTSSARRRCLWLRPAVGWCSGAT